MPPKSAKKTTQTDTFLLIVESPSKCAKIESYLGEKYQCISSKGHIREIDGLSQINTKDRFQIEFTPIKEKKDQIVLLKKTIAKYPPANILLATDDDREGEAIAWHICQVCGLDILSTKRIVFHEITQPALQEAVAHPGRINLSLVAAQQARQVLDIVVGFKISPLLWRHIGGNRKNALSAGRCQTPALRLVGDHHTIHKDALAKGANQIHRITGLFTNKSIAFHLDREFSDPTDLLAFLESSRHFDHRMSVGASKLSSKSPPKPFNTSRLLQVASNQFRLSPKTTMNLCQTLYQSGLITYMRTDCQKYSRVFLDKCAKYIVEEFGDKFVGGFEPLELIDASMPHEAIRVTNLALKTMTSQDPLLARLYKLIWRNTVESCMAAAKYTVTEVSITAPPVREPTTNSYKYTVETPVFLGWRRLEIKDSAVGGGKDSVLPEKDQLTETQTTDAGILFYLEQIANAGKPVAWSLIESKVAMDTRAPTHYTEASLIQKLEDLGIGRPSTFSSIVETIQERGYVRKTNVAGIRQKCVEFKLRPTCELERIETDRVFGEENDKLVIQPTGELVLEFLTAHFDDCFSYGYTKSMEDELDAMASQSAEKAMAEWYLICRRSLDDIAERSKPLARQAKQTFALADSAEYVLVFNSYGASLKKTAEDGTCEYAKVRPEAELDLEKAKRGEYTVAELIWREDNGFLGTYQDSPVYVKRGKYGLYAEYGSADQKETISLKSFEKDAANIPLLKDVVDLIERKHAILPPTGSGSEEDRDLVQTFTPTISRGYGQSAAAATANPGSANKSVLRSLRSDLSIRKGKFGPYIFHQTADMSKPEFYALKPIAKKWETMDNLELLAWIKNTYRGV